MFSFTDHDADDTVLSAPLDGVAEEMAYTDGVRDMLRLSRQSEARAVLGAGMIGDRAYNDRMNGQGPHATSRSHTKAHKYAIGEISLQLGITRGKAGEWSSLAQMLAHLPKIRLAYLAGDFSTHRVTELAKSSQIAPTGNLRERINEIIDAALGPRPNLGTDDHPDSPDDPVADEALEDPAQAPIDFEDIALELAYRPTPDTVLRDELDSALISLDPDAHAQAREDVARAFQNVTFAKEAFGHMEMSACLSAEHAIHLQHRIADLLDERVCRRDPRRVGHRRAIALAEIHGVPDVRLQCECGYDTCTARTRTTTQTEPVDQDIPETHRRPAEPVTETGGYTRPAEPTEPTEPAAAHSDTADSSPDQTPADESGDDGESTPPPRTARCDAPPPHDSPSSPAHPSSHACAGNAGSAHGPANVSRLEHLVVGERTEGGESPVDVRRVRGVGPAPAVVAPAPTVRETLCAATPRVHRIFRYRDYRCRHP
ncbi:hypothetical protein GIY30_16590 [Gordonia sp. HNM0687]|uniref:DUF222 domain-containing protein n=1 Tax=Gordonia mangrovi TaxID=2665643 RepID=A0A6L7GU20_9ACTN|nr:hypothetical protein [Gordonia mangrovi]MXP22957.1 hypothetical protein [Gordonia mangrovi]UVF77255.1 hypothetical protein NWF22_18400 [Gordonia mangrovi]